MRDYSKVAPAFWIGRTGRELRGDPAAQVVALYLVTGPSANMTGLYYLPFPTLVHETGLPPEKAWEALGRAIEAGFCRYDPDTEVVWVPEAARFQLGDSLAPGDKRIRGLVALLAGTPNSPFHKQFYEKYKVAYHLPNDGPWASPFEGPSKPLRSPFGGPSKPESREQRTENREKRTPPHTPPTKAADGPDGPDIRAGIDTYRQTLGLPARTVYSLADRQAMARSIAAGRTDAERLLVFNAVRDPAASKSNLAKWCAETKKLDLGWLLRPGEKGAIDRILAEIEMATVKTKGPMTAWEREGMSREDWEKRNAERERDYNQRLAAAVKPPEPPPPSKVIPHVPIARPTQPQKQTQDERLAFLAGQAELLKREG